MRFSKMGRFLTFLFWGTISLVFISTSLLSFIGMMISDEVEGAVIVVGFCTFVLGGSMLITLISDIYLFKSNVLTEHQKHRLNNAHPVSALTSLTYINIVNDLLKEKQELTALFSFKLLYWLSKYYILGFIAVCVAFVIAGFGMYLYK